MAKWDLSQECKVVQDMKISRYNIPQFHYEGKTGIMFSIDRKKPGQNSTSFHNKKEGIQNVQKFAQHNKNIDE